MATLMKCIEEMKDKIDNYPGDNIEHSFRVNVKWTEHLVELQWFVDGDEESTYVMFDAQWHDPIDKETKLDLIKAYKELGNALIREHNAQVYLDRLAKKPKQKPIANA